MWNKDVCEIPLKKTMYRQWSGQSDKVKKKRPFVCRLASCSSGAHHTDFSHCRLPFGTLRLQQPLWLHSPCFHSRLTAGWTPDQGREITAAASRLLVHFGRGHQLCPLSSHLQQPCVPILFSVQFSVIQLTIISQRKKSLSYIQHTSHWRNCNEVPQFLGDFLISLSNKTRISVKIMRKNIHIYVYNILCTFTQTLKKIKAAFSQRKCLCHFA